MREVLEKYKGIRVQKYKMFADEFLDIATETLDSIEQKLKEIKGE